MLSGWVTRPTCQSWNMMPPRRGPRCYLLPACHLLGAVDARRPGAAPAQGFICAFADDEAGPGTLGGKWSPSWRWPRPRAGWRGSGHGGNDDVAGKVQLAEAKGAEQGIVVHDGFPILGVRQTLEGIS